MSNINETIVFLKRNPKERYITITDEKNTVVGKKEIFIDDIPNDDLKAFVKFNLGTIDTQTMVFIELRQLKGASSYKHNSFVLRVEPDTIPMEKQPENQSPPAPQNSNVHFDMGMLNAGSQQIGLGVAQLMEFNRKADKLEYVTKENDKLEKQVAELTHKNNLQEVDLRDLKVKLAIADSQKEMAVLAIKSDNKTFFDSPAFEKIMEKLPDTVEKIIAAKSGNVQESAGALGMPGLSDAKKKFFDYVAEFPSDTEVAYLASICHFIDNPDFMKELQQIVIKYNNNGN